MNVREGAVPMLILGSLLLLVATLYHINEIILLGVAPGPVVALLLDGGLAVGVIYIGWHLRDTEFIESEYSMIWRWAVSGFVIGGGLIGLTFVVWTVEERPIIEPQFLLLIGMNGGTLAGTLAGYYAVRSRATVRKYEQIFDNTYQLTGLLARDGTLIEANATALRFGELDRNDVIGEHLSESYWVQPYPESQQVVEQAITRAQKGEFFGDQIQIQGKAASAMIDFSIRPLHDESGEVAQLIVEGRDITKIKRQQEHLSVLHTYLRHNLRNDVNIIRGYSDLLLDKLEMGPHTDRVETIHETATDLRDSSELVKEFADATPADSDETSAHRLKPIVEEVCDRAAISTSQLNIDISPDQSVYVNEQIHLVFEEFLNALESHLESRGTLKITDKTLDDKIEVEIVGAGLDIPSAELSAFDQPAERSKTNHPDGIRFWLMKSTMKDHRGDITYDDNSDSETKIRIKFDRAPTNELSTSSLRPQSSA